MGLLKGRQAFSFSERLFVQERLGEELDGRCSRRVLKAMAVRHRFLAHLPSDAAGNLIAFADGKIEGRQSLDSINEALQV